MEFLKTERERERALIFDSAEAGPQGGGLDGISGPFAVAVFRCTLWIVLFSPPSVHRVIPCFEVGDRAKRGETSRLVRPPKILPGMNEDEEDDDGSPPLFL